MEYYLSQPKALGEHQFAIIDKAFASELVERFPSLDMVSAHLKPQAHLYPALISLHELPASDWQMLLAEIKQQSVDSSTPKVCLFLESLLSAESLCNELANALLISDEKHQNYLLRYYDPRVLFQLSWMLTPWQLQIYLKTQVVPSWTFWLDKQWHTLNFSEKINYHKNTPIDLPLAQLHRIGLINQILSKYSPFVSLDERNILSQQIDSLLLRATEYGLNTNEDIMTFVKQGCSLQCAFWLHHDVQALLKISAHNPNYYSRITSSWHDSHWQEIKSHTPILAFSKGLLR